ncbi:group II intron reverse transcriptase/maturase [Streptomyces brasiliensis]|uniref:Group II intron reverse transcriptase/maturase n=1 Tax=Streptomyces brasiliensis TaxID=1954 RepID=A0A917P9N3_9ACTN|nr:group II intron reverse transcriptase/maturase [Streptomyces brasiliensis]
MYGTFMHENREVPLLARRVDHRAGRPGNAEGGTPGMNESGKSDDCVVPVKSANKGPVAAGTAESVEGRRSAKGNTAGKTPPGRSAGIGASSALDRVREVAVRDKDVRFTALLHHVDLARLWKAYAAIRREAAPGVDGVTWEEYGQDLRANLEDLHARVQQGRYRAKPSRRVYIPKADGRQRPLGIASLEDKIVQRAVVEVLNAVYEVDFRGFSYGFRPGRGPHDALDALAVGLTSRRVNWVLDADIRDFFTTLDHEWLGRFLRHRIGDERVLRLVGKWLTAGVVEDGTWAECDQGSPQGASVSPLLANVYLHYVLDLWVEWWRRQPGRGDVIIVRWADDFIVGFEQEQDARRFLDGLRGRFAEFGLELHPDKTRLIEFGRNADWKRRRRGVGKPETFDFLGFTHICARSRRGRFWVKRITIAKRMRAKLREIKVELKRRQHRPVPEQGVWLRSVVQGHLVYYAVPGNTDAVRAFCDQVTRHWFKALRRRSQKTRLTWARMTPLARRWLPPVRVRHPFPEARFAART